MADVSKLLAATAQLVSHFQAYVKATGPGDQAEIDAATDEVLKVDAQVVSATPTAK